jgi:hypothetical protein
MAISNCFQSIRYRRHLANDVNQFLDDVRRIMGVQMICLGFYSKLNDEDEKVMRFSK